MRLFLAGAYFPTREQAEDWYEAKVGTYPPDVDADIGRVSWDHATCRPVAAQWDHMLSGTYRVLLKDGDR